MKLLPLVAAALLTGVAALGFAKALDRLAPPPQAATVLRPFPAERVPPLPRSPAPVPRSPAPLSTPPQTVIAPDPAPAAILETTFADPPPPEAPFMSLLPEPRSPLDAAGDTRRYDFNEVPLIGVYR